MATALASHNSAVALKESQYTAAQKCLEVLSKRVYSIYYLVL